MSLSFDVSRYHFDESFIFGLMCGLEFDSEKPMSSLMVLKNIKKGGGPIMNYKKEIKVIELNELKSYKAFEKEMRSMRLYDFFMGTKKETFTSVGLLQKLKQK